MAKTKAQQQQATGQRAAIYARVSDKSQDADDKTSISEQISDMQAHCERRGLAIVVRYQEVGKGWSKKRPEFQRMLADARSGRFDTIVCWKSDRLSRGMYPAAALMEVVEAHQIQLEAVMDAIDMKTFGLMAAIGKIELDNFRERAAMGKRGSAKQGKIPAGRLPYGYRIGDDGRPGGGGIRVRAGAPHLPHVRSRRDGSSLHSLAADGRRNPRARFRRAVVSGEYPSSPGECNLQGRLELRTDQAGPDGAGHEGLRATQGHVDRHPGRADSGRGRRGTGRRSSRSSG